MARGANGSSVFFADLQKVCADKGVEILRGMVRKIQVPEEIQAYPRC